jgi:diguanylate cyclase (GGDEF)-like protein/PAS domain S-box-containing protein
MGGRVDEQRRSEVPRPDGIAGTGVDPGLLEALLPHLAESLMVLDGEWNVKANLAPPGGLIGRGLGLGLHTLEDMHPDDAVQVLDLGMQAFSTEPGWEGSMVVRMQRGDGTYGRYEITAINRFDDPVVDGMVVRTREIAHESAPSVPGLEHRLAAEVLAELLPTGVVVLDDAGRPVYANASACGLLRREPEEIKRDGLLDLVDADDRERLAAVLGRVTTVSGRELCTVRLAGRRDVVECRLMSVGEPEVSVVVLTLEDVTARQAAEAALERRANHDGLTGVRNRSSVLDLLRDRLATGAPTAVAYLDLDGFKGVNDVGGHAEGDRLLIAVAQALVDALPEAVVGRIGGDEFVVVTDERSSAALAEEIRGVVAGVERARRAGVTSSVGVAVAAGGDGPRDLLHRADEEMYADKRRRRSGVAAGDPPGAAR